MNKNWKDSTVLLDIKVDLQKVWNSVPEEQKKKWDTRRKRVIDHMNRILFKEKCL